MGYHSKNKIFPNGKYGEFSKIQEEFMELEDAYKQSDKILQLCELSDLFGAMEGYVQNEFGMSMDDLKNFSNKTKSTFQEKIR